MVQNISNCFHNVRKSRFPSCSRVRFSAWQRNLFRHKMSCFKLLICVRHYFKKVNHAVYTLRRAISMYIWRTYHDCMGIYIRCIDSDAAEFSVAFNLACWHISLYYSIDVENFCMHSVCKSTRLADRLAF